MKSTFGDRFKMLRNEKGLKQEDLIIDFNKKYHYNFTRAAVSQYENNKRIPEIEALKSFADYFNVSVDFLLGNTDIRNKIDSTIFSGPGKIKDIKISKGNNNPLELFADYITNENDEKKSKATTLKEEFITMLKERNLIKNEDELTPSLALKILSEIFEEEKRGTD